MIYRRLILIANNGGTDNYLPAVSLDMKHYRDYFSSPEGGAWDDSEIVFYDNNCTEEKLAKYIKDHPIVLYYQIVFCGHGYTTLGGDTVLELQPGEDCPVSTIKRWLSDKIVLLITDSCRKVYPNPQPLSEGYVQRTFSSTRSEDIQYRRKCRLAFLDSITNIPNNYFVEGYACQIGECAYDNDNIGGFYSTSLLDKALQEIKYYTSISSVMRKTVIGYFASIHDSIIDYVNQWSLKDYQKPQHPSRKWGDYIPFYVVPSK